jgi:flagellar biosynthesis protein FlhB
MSEDRNQTPSKRRRQLVREQGQAAHSPELTAAGGWLVAVLLLGYWGGDLAHGLIALTRQSLSGTLVVRIDPVEFVAHIRGVVLAVAVPLGLILTGFMAGAVAVHQIQVQGLWAPALMAPDPARLWNLGRRSGLAPGLERIAWALVKAIILGSVSLWAIRAEWVELQRLSRLELPVFGSLAGRVVLQPARILGLVMLILGLADYGLRYLRFEAMLLTTAEEQREDRRAIEGDLPLRARRRSIARAWRGDAPELLAGASLIVSGASGLVVVLAGGPPPRRLTIRTVAQGNAGDRVRGSISAARLPQIDAPELASRLAQHAAVTAALPAVVPAELMAEIAAVWPS